MLFSRIVTGLSRSLAARVRKAAAARAAAAAAAVQPARVDVLEQRSLLSVSIGSDGFTDVGKSGDSKVIYVSSSSGSDSNSGASPESAVRSVSKGISLMRSGSPDHLLLKRGDSWTENLTWGKSGRSASEPAYLGAYGSGNRPLIKAGGGNGIEFGGGGVSHVVIQGIHLFAHNRDPQGSGYAGSSGGGYGMRLVGKSSGLLIEDTVVDQFKFNLLFQSHNGNPANIKLRRNVISDAYSGSTGEHSSGIFAQGVNGLLLEENVFDHNGWNPAKGGQSPQNHNAYISEGNNGVVVKGNIFANASSHGLQVRSGGEVRDNLFLNNPIHMSFGLVNGSPLKAGGVTGTVSGNVFLGSRTLGGSPRGWGIEIGNISSASIRDNIFHDSGPGQAGAFMLGVGKNLTNAGSGVGINNLTIEDNVVHDWHLPVEMSGALNIGGSGNSGLRNLTVRNNDFQYAGGQYNRLIARGGTLNASHEKWSNNRWFDESNSAKWMFVGNSDMSFSSWKSRLEPSGQQTRVNYNNPNASIDSYAGSTSSFLSRARSQSSSNWSSGPAKGAIAYMRGAFNMGAPTTPTPTPTTPTPTPTTPTPTPTTPTPTTPVAGFTPEVNIANAAATEGNSGTRQIQLPVTLTGASTKTVKVNFATKNSTAGEGDYGTTSGSVTFAPGETSKTITVNIKSDTKIENNEVFRVNLSNASNATISDGQADGTIVNDDGPNASNDVPVAVTPTPTPTPTSGGDRTAPSVLSYSGSATSVKVRFSENVRDSLVATDLKLRKPSTGDVVANSLRLSYNASTNEATWTWAAVSSNGRISSGTWEATLDDKSVKDAAGNTLAGDLVFRFTA